MFMLEAYLIKQLNKKLHKGNITARLPNGSQHTFGDGSGPAVGIAIKSFSALTRMLMNPRYQVGRCYVTGAWEPYNCTLRELLITLASNNTNPPHHWLAKILPLQRYSNPIVRSRKNVSYHYDLEADFFKLFLDREMNYSCAYYTDEHVSLDDAQQAKCQHIAQKLCLKPGMRVLDIGCGWGSMALYLAEKYQVHVTGITLSKRQLEVANARVSERGLQDLVTFELSDYRQHLKQYDRIVSIGMLEHVGMRNYEQYFNCVKNNLTEDGVALIHTIGTPDRPGPTNPWIVKNIFPGGYIPTLSQLAAAIEQSYLVLSDHETLRQHYAYTLRDWASRFGEHREAILKDRGEDFCRTWEFYLASCEAFFRCLTVVVFQMQLIKKGSQLSITRDYMQHS